jgi:hypothetical protein
MKETTETRELTDDELNLVAGARTNAEDPFVQTAIFAMRRAIYLDCEWCRTPTISA